eukprot:5805125-Amphidinium_carterae.2
MRSNPPMQLHIERSSNEAGGGSDFVPLAPETRLDELITVQREREQDAMCDSDFVCFVTEGPQTSSKGHTTRSKHMPVATLGWRCPCTQDSTWQEYQTHAMEIVRKRTLSFWALPTQQQKVSWRFDFFIYHGTCTSKANATATWE